MDLWFAFFDLRNEGNTDDCKNGEGRKWLQPEILTFVWFFSRMILNILQHIREQQKQLPESRLNLITRNAP